MGMLVTMSRAGRDGLDMIVLVMLVVKVPAVMNYGDMSVLVLMALCLSDRERITLCNRSGGSS